MDYTQIPKPRVLSETDLESIRGGMFAPFVNSRLTQAPHQPAPLAPANPVTARSLAGALTEGAVAGYMGAAAAGVPPQARGPFVAGAALVQGTAHIAGGWAQSMSMPGPGRPIANLNLPAYSRNPFGPTYSM